MELGARGEPPRLPPRRAAVAGAGAGRPDAGRIANLRGTGWTTLAAKGIFRPAGEDAAHLVEAGLQRDANRLRTLVSNSAAWAGGAAGAPVSRFDGDTVLAGPVGAGPLARGVRRPARTLEGGRRRDQRRRAVQARDLAARRGGVGQPHLRRFPHHAQRQVPGQPAGRWQPRVPRWRASQLVAAPGGARWSGSVGVRYGGLQYGQLDNSDPNGQAFTGFGRFLVVDLRAQVRLAPGWKASVGVDNLNNRTYWAFHPYPQRTFTADLRWDL